MGGGGNKKNGLFLTSFPLSSPTGSLRDDWTLRLIQLQRHLLCYIYAQFQKKKDR
jgi:hypothetical protein